MRGAGMRPARGEREVGSLATLIVVMIVLVRTIPAVRKQWREDRPGFIKTLKIAGLYIVYCFAGLGLGFLVLPEPGSGNDAAAAIFTLFIVGWIFYGGLWLMRLVPRYKTIPAWIDKPGALDVIFLVTLGGCLAWLTS